MCIQWTHVLYSGVITQHSHPPISQFSSLCNEFTSGWLMFPCNAYSLIKPQYNANIWTSYSHQNKHIMLYKYSVLFLYKLAQCTIGKQRALSLDIWMSPSMCVILGEIRFVALLKSAWEKYTCSNVQIT